MYMVLATNLHHGSYVGSLFLGHVLVGADCHELGVARFQCGLLMFSKVPAFFGFGLEDDHVPTFWLLLYMIPAVCKG